MNLPRSMRFKRENIILLRILPGPSEPKHDVNPYIEPLIDELCEMWTGVTMQVHTVSSSELVRCALLCVACNLPAQRKLCGFLGYSAKLVHLFCVCEHVLLRSLPCEISRKHDYICIDGIYRLRYWNRKCTGNIISVYRLGLKM